MPHFVVVILLLGLRVTLLYNRDWTALYFKIRTAGA